MAATMSTARATTSVRAGNVAPQTPPFPLPPPQGPPGPGNPDYDPLLPPDYDANDPDEAAPQRGLE